MASHHDPFRVQASFAPASDVVVVVPPGDEIVHEEVLHDVVPEIEDDPEDPVSVITPGACIPVGHDEEVRWAYQGALKRETKSSTTVTV